MQECRDLVTSATLAFQDADEEDKEKAQETWRTLAEKFWQQEAGAEAERKAANPKLFRVKAYEWICCTVHMLMAACGVNFDS